MSTANRFHCAMRSVSKVKSREVVYEVSACGGDLVSH
jgi:hypothetical protein